MMKWYSVESTVTKSVYIEMIRHGFSPPDTDSIDNTNTEIITRNNGRGIIIDEWEKLETYCFYRTFIIIIIYNIIISCILLSFHLIHVILLLL